MRSTSYVPFDDCFCEVRSNCHLGTLEQPRRTCRLEAPPTCHDPEFSPQEHSEAHPDRFATVATAHK